MKKEEVGAPDEDVKTGEEDATVEASTLEQAERIVRNHWIASAGVAAVPLPLLDTVALTGIQLNMLFRMSKVYDVPFSRDKVKNIIAPLIVGVMPAAFARPLMSGLSVIPFAGPLLGAFSMPVLSGAVTYALGKVFIQHFESGGTFLTFDPEKVKTYFNEQVQAGKDLVKRQTSKPAAA